MHDASRCPPPQPNPSTANGGVGSSEGGRSHQTALRQAATHPEQRCTENPMADLAAQLKRLQAAGSNGVLAQQAALGICHAAISTKDRHVQAQALAACLQHERKVNIAVSAVDSQIGF